MSSILPAPGALAEEVRHTSLADVATAYGVTVGGVIRRLNRHGYTQAGNIQTAKRPTPTPRVADVGLDDLEGALCRDHDPEWWFQDSPRHAKYVCNGDKGLGIAPCPVRGLCLQGALARREDYGVFGGLDPKERKKLKRKGAAA